MRYGDKNEHSFVMGRYGNRIMAQTKYKGDHTRTLHDAFQAAVAVPLSLFGIPFRAASKGNLPGPIGRVRDFAKTPGEKSAKKRQVNGITPDIIIGVRNAMLNQLIPSTSPTWFDQAETICDVRTLSPHDTSGYFSIADTDSIKPIGKRARKVHDEYTKAARRPLTRKTTRALRQVPRDRSKPSLCDTGPVAHPHAHEVAGFGVGAFGELSAGCSGLCNLAARVQAASYVAYYGDKLQVTQGGP